MGKPNAMLEKLKAQAEAKAKAEYDIKVLIHNEIDLIAHLISCHEDLGVGPGRAERCLNGFLESKMDVAEAIVKESDEDEQGEFLVTQRDLAKQLKEILGPEAWERQKHKFPLLKDFWDIV